MNGIAVNNDELFKAACCNMGESFTTNPSVDVAYKDATTGARQIKLLGLSGTYVQMCIRDRLSPSPSAMDKRHLSGRCGNKTYPSNCREKLARSGAYKL